MSTDSSVLTRGLEKIEELLSSDTPVSIIKRVQLSSMLKKGKQIKTVDDVEDYIKELKNNMIEAINDDKEILI
jgi:predicted transcriptional regulator of viral defense system